MINLEKLMSALVTRLPAARFVVPLGDTASRVWATADSERTFYLLGSMGMSFPLALGTALGDDRRVVAIEGDGGLLMNLGGLATVARYGGPNLGLIVLDNGSYATTGAQATSWRATRGIVAMAIAAGISETRTFGDAGSESDLADWIGEPGLRLAVAVVPIDRAKFATVSAKPEDLARRFTQGNF